MPAIGKAYRFSNSRRDLPTLFGRTAIELGIRYKLIRPYKPRRNGKVERNYREDKKHFYAYHFFFPLPERPSAHNRRANNLPRIPFAVSFLLSRVGHQEVQPGGFVYGAVLDQTQLRIRDTAAGDHLHVHLDPLTGIGHLLIGLGRVGFLLFLRREHPRSSHDPIRISGGPGVAALS